MYGLKAIFKFYIDSSIHVSLAVCAMVLTTSFVIPTAISAELLGFVFFSTITGYNFVKYAGIAGLHHRSLTKNLRFIQLFSLLNFIGLLVLAVFQPIEVLLISAFLGFFTLLYAIPFLPRGKNLRSLKSIKIFIIAFVWAGTAVWLPTQNVDFIFSVEARLRFLQIFVFVLALILPFEIRDLTYDSKELRTLPQLIGVEKTKALGYVLLMLFFLLEFTITSEVKNLIPTFMITLLTGMLIYFSSKKQSDYYASFWVESLPIIWWGLLCLTKVLFVF